MQRANNIILIAGVLVGCASVSACKSDDEGGGNAGAGGMTGGVGGSTGGSAGVAGTMTGGAGGSTGGMGGVAGTMTGGVGGSTGGVGGSTGGVGGMTGGMGGMTGGMGGMTGGMGGMTGGMGGGEPDAGGGDSATFTEVYSIIMMKCGGGDFGCHVTGSSGGLNMNSKMMAFTNLVGIDSGECDDEKRVVAGDADNSLLIQALEGTACVDQMPRGRDPLSEDEIATIREWIDDGAMNN
jgi:hypothetical protein